MQGERATDAAAFAAMGEDTTALFLRASNVAQSKPPKDAERGGRLAVRAVNYVVEHIGEYYNAELEEGDRLRIKGKLHPHMLRHTFAYQLCQATDADTYELQRRLGHRSQRYIELYTSPPGRASLPATSRSFSSVAGSALSAVMSSLAALLSFSLRLSLR